MARMGRLMENASAVGMLARDGGAYVTGQMIWVNGEVERR
ncbi:MAG: hypothetical protein RLZZ187_2001 [Pseudomonadota bacterium]|jgi:NAD(P)-dependent dehydrogenase (short-subunit alcohol dehydrogenase family)